MLPAGGRSPRAPGFPGACDPAPHGVVRIVLSTICAEIRSRAPAVGGTVPGMDIAVRAVDPHDDAALAAAHKVQATALAYDVPDLPAPCPVRYAGMLRHPTRSRTQLSWLGLLDGRPAGVLDLSLPMLEDTGNADIELF